MTNKEAIEELKGLQDFINDTRLKGEIRSEALDLAIKALEERPTGKWVEHTDRSNNRYGCNICGSLVNIKSSFCPWCGVKMEGEEE